MDLKQRMNVVQAKMNGTVAALTYGYMTHMNNAGANIIDIGTDKNAVNSDNIENSACSSEMLRGLVHAFQDSYKGALAVDSTVCDPKYIPWNCVMKDKNGITQRGAAADLFIDYPYATKAHKKLGKDWSEVTIDEDKYHSWNYIYYANGIFLAIGDWNYYDDYTHYAKSTDGIHWELGYVNTVDDFIYSVCYGNDKFVAPVFNTNKVVYSTDGSTWTISTSGLTSRKWNDICYGNGKFIMVSEYTNYFAYSTDGINWTESTISSTSRVWERCCYGNSMFVAIAYNSTYFAYSTNGTSWTEGTISGTSRRWNCICYGNDKFVIVARDSNYFAYSTNGTSWTEKTVGTVNRKWRDVCYGNGIYILVEYGTPIGMYSTNGTSWSEIMIHDQPYWYGFTSVCYGNGMFVCTVDDDSMFVISRDIVDYELISNYATWESETTDISSNTGIKSNPSTIEEGFITYNRENKSIYGVIPFGDIIAPVKLKTAIQNNECYFITKNYKYENRNDQFYRYLTFTDNGTSYIGITNDMMHFTVYNITGSYTFRDGVILMHIPEKDALVMITRHPITTDIITIDGNDPENMTDYSKPYYRLIELPFLKKYYKYSGKHVQNVKLGISTYIDADSPVVDPLTDNTLIVTVFNKIYSIGIPNWVSNNLNAQNNKRFNSVFTAASMETDAAIGMKKSTVFTTYGNSNNTIIADCITTRNNCATNILNYDFDNPEYDKPADESTTIMTNMMCYQFNTLGSINKMTVAQIEEMSVSDIEEMSVSDIENTIIEEEDPDIVIYPVTTYDPDA